MSAVNLLSTSKAVSLADTGLHERSDAPQSLAARGGAQAEIQPTPVVQDSAAPIATDASAQRQATSALTDLLPSGGFHPAADDVAAKGKKPDSCQQLVDRLDAYEKTESAADAVKAWIHRTWN